MQNQQTLTKSVIDKGLLYCDGLHHNILKLSKDLRAQVYLGSTLKYYKYMSLRQLSFVTGKLSYVIEKFANLTVDLHCFFINSRGSPRTHMLILKGSMIHQSTS